jgi:hypothetical protein
MSVSARKIQANRANAQHSTGPRSPEGKAASALNSRRHGLASRELCVPPSRHAEFAQMEDDYFRDIRPTGPVQLAFFAQLVHAVWNLRVAREFHARAFAAADFPNVDRLLRYITKWERSFEKALKALQAEQENMALRAIGENEPIAQLPVTCPVRKIANEATRIARCHHADPGARRYAILSAIGNAFRPFPPPAGQNEPTAA